MFLHVTGRAGAAIFRPWRLLAAVQELEPCDGIHCYRRFGLNFLYTLPDDNDSALNEKDFTMLHNPRTLFAFPNETVKQATTN